MADRTRAQTTHTPFALLDQEASERKHLFTVEEYRKMGEVGIFTEDDRVELVEGEIVEMTPIGARHVQVLTALTTILASRLADNYDLSVQNPLELGVSAEYQPDLTLLVKDRPKDHVPVAGEAVLVVEVVAHSSLSYDRNVKLPLYAKAKVPEVWLIDLISERIEVHSDPREGAGGYGRVERFGHGEQLRSATLSSLALSVDEVLST